MKWGQSVSDWHSQASIVYNFQMSQTHYSIHTVRRTNYRKERRTKKKRYERAGTFCLYLEQQCVCCPSVCCCKNCARSIPGYGHGWIRTRLDHHCLTKVLESHFCMDGGSFVPISRSDLLVGMYSYVHICTYVCARTCVVCTVEIWKARGKKENIVYLKRRQSSTTIASPIQRQRSSDCRYVATYLTYAAVDW